MQPAVALDFTPAATHGYRGIGRYVRGLYDALATVDPAWVASKLGLLLLPAGRPKGIAPAFQWETVDWTFRVADAYWPARLVGDRLALRGVRYSAWHGTDPRAPRPPQRGAATIETAYDLIPLRHQTPATRFAHRRFFYGDYLRRLRSADLVLCISQTTADDVERALRRSMPCLRVVPPVVEAPTAATEDGAREAMSNRLELLYVGALDAHKRPVLALEAAAALARRGADVVLRFAGLTPQPGLALLRARIAQLAMTERVQILGPVGESELWSHLRRAAVLLFPSADEGFGLPPLEAMSVGTPVVAADTPIARETMANAALLVPDEANAYADAVERLVGDSALRSTLRARGATRVAEFSPSAIGRRVLEVYRELGAY